MAAIAMQAPVIITVDTCELRQSSPVLSPNQRKLQQRIAGWTPRSPTELSFSDKIEGARRRRQSLVSKRRDALAQSNTRASVVAETSKTKFANITNSKATDVLAKLTNAEQKRKALVSATVSSAATHIEHARCVAEQQKALKKQKTEQAITATELRVNEAGARRANLLAQARRRAASELAKAKEIQLTLSQRQLEMKTKNEDKLAAAEARRSDIQDQLARKLAEDDEHARQVRRNKGSTPSRATLNAEKKIYTDVPGVTFDMDVRAPTSPNKTPVQIRLEERLAAEVNFNDNDDDVADKARFVAAKLASAEQARNALTSAKEASAASHWEHARSIAEHQAEAQTAKQAQAAKHAAAKIKAAEERRAALLTNTAKRAAGHVEAAMKNAMAIKSDNEEKLEERKRRLSQELLEHDERRAAALKAKAAPLSPRRTPTKAAVTSDV